MAVVAAKSEPGDEADGEIEPEDDLGRDLLEVEALVRDVEQQMRRHVAERADADHAAHVRDLPVAADAPERRNGERDEEEAMSGPHVRLPYGGRFQDPGQEGSRPNAIESTLELTVPRQGAYSPELMWARP